jgi:hypothetical protein
MLYRLRRRLMLERCWRSLRLWAASGTFSRARLQAGALSGLRAAAAATRAGMARAAARWRSGTQQRVLTAWHLTAADQVSAHMVEWHMCENRWSTALLCRALACGAVLQLQSPLHPACALPAPCFERFKPTLPTRPALPCCGSWSRARPPTGCAQRTWAPARLPLGVALRRGSASSEPKRCGTTRHGERSGDGWQSCSVSERRRQISQGLLSFWAPCIATASLEPLLHNRQQPTSYLDCPQAANIHAVDTITQANCCPRAR